MAATSDDEIDAATVDSSGAPEEVEVVAVAAAAADDEEEEEEAVAAVEDDDEEEEEEEEEEATTPAAGKKRKRQPPPAPPSVPRKGRTPAVQGLTIPFRAIKRTMKIDPIIGTVQNEAAIVTTMAAELFVQALAKESYQNASSRGRNTIRCVLVAAW